MSWLKTPRARTLSRRLETRRPQVRRNRIWEGSPYPWIVYTPGNRPPVTIHHTWAEAMEAANLLASRGADTRPTTNEPPC